MTMHRREIPAGFAALSAAGPASALQAAKAVTPEARLRALGLELPTSMPARARYAPYRLWKGLLFIAGQGPLPGSDPPMVGRFGAELSVAQGRAAARSAALALIAQARIACKGDLSRVEGWMSLTGYVHATPTFLEHPLVMDGATELLFDVFGDSGLPARTSVGVASLPFGIPVELDAIVALRN